MQNIWLIGLPGCGKSTLGRRAAEALGFGFADADAMIEESEGRRIADIFAQQGEAHFRALETETIRTLSAREGLLIAVGGGAVLKGENTARMRENGLVICLNRAVGEILQTLETDSRPLLAEGRERLYSLAAERGELYALAAHRALFLHGTEEESLALLLDAIRLETLREGYVLIGDPVAQSLSPPIHETVFRAYGTNDRYTTLRVPKADLPRFMERVRAASLPGFNVTIPHKRAVLPLLDEVDAEARRCASVNTVLRRGARLIGYNTDMEGLRLSLADKGRGYRGERLAVLGTGGAAVPTAHKAAREGASSLLLLGRDLEAARQIAAELAALYPACSVGAEPFDAACPRVSLEDVTLLINATPLGMTGFGTDFGDFGFLDSLPRDALVCDLIFKPAETALLKAAAARGLETMNGLGMLIYQAILADQLYMERTIDIQAMAQSVLSALRAQGFVE